MYVESRLYQYIVIACICYYVILLLSRLDQHTVIVFICYFVILYSKLAQYTVIVLTGRKPPTYLLTYLLTVIVSICYYVILQSRLVLILLSVSNSKISPFVVRAIRNFV